MCDNGSLAIKKSLKPMMISKGFGINTPEASNDNEEESLSLESVEENENQVMEDDSDEDKQYSEEDQDEIEIYSDSDHDEDDY
jgi:hypothetical protein